MAAVYKSQGNDSHQKLSLEPMLCRRSVHDSRVQWKFTQRDFMCVIRLDFHPVPNRSPFDLLIILLHAERFQLFYTEADRMRGFIVSACLISRLSQRGWRKRSRFSVRCNGFGIFLLPMQLSSGDEYSNTMLGYLLHSFFHLPVVFSLQSQSVVKYIFSRVNMSHVCHTSNDSAGEEIVVSSS